jgi:hypothetical protein
VVRDDDWAIGMLGLDDNTIAGPPVDSDCYEMGYFIHSEDPVKDPLPPQYKEGQWISINANGGSDESRYSAAQEYFHLIVGNGAQLDPDFGSTVAYHSRDRRRSYSYLWTLLPGTERYRPRHQVSDPIPGVDFIGSAVALYACPDDLGLATIGKITLAEGVPHVMIHGKWIRDLTAFSPTVYWSGPYDKAIQYTKALGIKDLSRDTGEFYPNLASKWVGSVGFANGKSMTCKEFSDEAHDQGLTFGGLHTLCLFLQGGISNDVTPVPSEHLQTVCRTKLAKDISATDTDIVVTDPSFLADKGTWPLGDDSNYLRIGGEMLRYSGISASAPWTLQGVTRGHASRATAHKAGDELVKLQQDCYNGFAPDMTLMPKYADYYAELMVRNGMDTINFDGFESTLYQNQGYYGIRCFCRRLFDTYAKLTGGKAPRVTGSCAFAGAWLYMNVCDLGAGTPMFDPMTGRRGTEGKDIGDGFSNSYFPATFGIQNFNSNWTVYDAENLESKSIGWDATYALGVSQAALDNCGDRDAIFKAFQAWQNARAAGLFSRELKLKLRDPDLRFHLAQLGSDSYRLSEVKETALWADADGKPHPVTLTNDGEAQPMDFALKIAEPRNEPVPVSGIVITLPDGSRIRSDRPIRTGEFIICREGRAYTADANRRKIADLPLGHPATLPSGEAKFILSCAGAPTAGQPKFMLTVWHQEKGQMLEK